MYYNGMILWAMRYARSKFQHLSLVLRYNFLTAVPTLFLLRLLTCFFKSVHTKVEPIFISICAFPTYMYNGTFTAFSH